MTDNIPKKIITLFVLILIASSQALATVGFAEWAIITPGGNTISDSDVAEEQFGIALVKGSPRNGGEDFENILIPNLIRWRYFEGYVAAEAKKGFYIVKESSGETTVLNTEEQMNQSLKSLGIDSPITDWLIPSDGYQEAWYPYFYWPVCAYKKGKKDIFDLTEKQIKSLTDHRLANQINCEEMKKKVKHYRLGVWGDICKRIDIEGLPPDKKKNEKMWEEFCRDILS